MFNNGKKVSLDQEDGPVKRRVLVIGIGMLVVGGYMFIQSMFMITNMSTGFDWATWTIYLTAGIILFSVGPGVMAWAFTSEYPTVYGKSNWQIIRMPQNCPECKNLIEIRSLEWIGPDEARCPFCSSQIEITRSIL